MSLKCWLSPACHPAGMWPSCWICRAKAWQRLTPLPQHQRQRFCSTSSNNSQAGTIKKQLGGTIMTPELYQYILQHTREPEVDCCWACSNAGNSPV